GRFARRRVIADSNIAEPGQPPQIDQQVRGRQAEGENRHQVLPPCDDERLRVRRERGDCFSKSAGSLVTEGRRFHCYALRGKTEPQPTCTPSVRESAVCATPKRSHEHRELATALSVRVKTANTHALTAA